MVVFEEWVDMYSPDIERFAFQYGCSLVEAAEVAEETFHTIYTNLEKLADGKRYVYKTALEKLGQVEQTNPRLASPILFKEDAEFHSKIIQLDEKYRVPLVLHLFHEFSFEEINEVMAIPLDEVVANIQAARELLREAIGYPPQDVFKKRVEFLWMSYDRLPLLFNVVNVSRGEHTPVINESKKLSPKGWITAIILGFLLIGIVGSTYFTGEEWELRSDRKYIDKLKKEYAKKVDEKKAILGVSEDIFNQIPFIADANEQVNTMLVGLENKNREGGKIDRQLADDKLLEVNEMMKLPSELADELFAAPLVNDVEKSMMFAEHYLRKADGIKYSLYELFADDYDKLQESLANGTFDAEVILSQKDEYSESTRSAIAALINQDLALPQLPITSTTQRTIRLMDSVFIGRLRAALHEAAGSYLTQYEKEPFIMNEKLLYSLDETIEIMEEMEKTLVAARQNQWLGHVVEGTMINLLEMILQGSTIEEFKSSDGSISEVHRNAWKQLASLGPDSGLGVIMAKVVEEMEESDWKRSELYSSLDDWRVYEAYSLAVEGNLEHFGMKPLKEMYDDLTFRLPNDQFNVEIENLFNEFSDAYDRDVLKNVHPLLILDLYYYANDKEDSVMMWHLTEPASREASLDEYETNDWVKEIALLDVTDSIRYNPSLIMDDGHKVLVPIEFERNGKMYYNVWMTYAKDQVWQVEKIVIEEGEL